MSEQFNPQFQTPQPYVPMAKRKRNWVLPTILIVLLVVLISLPIIIIGVFVSGLSSFESKPVEVSQNSVLEISLNQFMEAPKISPFSFLEDLENRQTLFSIVTQIENAKKDDRIKGIIIKDGIGQYGFGIARELIEALKSFKQSGKFIYSYLTFANENVLMVASVSDSIFAPKMGFFELNGYGVTNLFFKGFFDKIGVDYYVEHFEDFKSAGESFDRTKFSDSSKKQLRILLEQRYDEFLTTLADNRKIDKNLLNSSINRGQYSTDSLISIGLIDGIATPAEFRDKVYYKIFGELPNYDTENDKKVNYIDILDYTYTPDAEQEIFDKNIKIAYIETEGAITSSDQSLDGLEEGITDGRLVKTLEEIRKDKKIKAVILRINSPGGSALASDNIWYSIRELRKEKPVYASMSDVAASGGYYIAMACDTIIAYPNTITGSIGVIGMIPNVAGTMDKLGITVDTINIGENSQFLNGSVPFKESDKAKFRTLMKSIYDDFVAKAAESRKMTFEKLRSYAKGRVWSGTDALKYGLVDTLGGIKTAFELAKQRLGIPKDKKVYVEFYPKLDQSFEAFLKFLRNFGRNYNMNSQLSLLTQNTDLSLATKIFNSLPKTFQQQILYNFKLIQIGQKENVLLTLPFLIQ